MRPDLDLYFRDLARIHREEARLFAERRALSHLVQAALERDQKASSISSTVSNIIRRLSRSIFRNR